jgi:hypothetical protein
LFIVSDKTIGTTFVPVPAVNISLPVSKSAFFQTDGHLFIPQMCLIKPVHSVAKSKSFYGNQLLDTQYRPVSALLESVPVIWITDSLFAGLASGQPDHLSDESAHFWQKNNPD